MRTLFTLFSVVLLVPLANAAPEDRETIKFIQSLQNADGGFLPMPQDPNLDQVPRSTLRATSAAIRSLKYLGGELMNKEKTTKFVASCLEERSGGYADSPQGKPDIFGTAVGIMAAAELKMDEAKFIKPAVGYLAEHAKEFEDTRIAIAGFEAAKQFPEMKVREWLDPVAKARNADGSYGKPAQDSRMTGSMVAMLLRAGRKLNEEERAGSLKILLEGQRADGAFAKTDAKSSDLETTYRVMRAFHLLGKKPKDVEALKGFIAQCRGKDGGYGVAPGQPPTIFATYFAAIITHWLQ